jgi:type II secretory ATPase GspE/PulE/Tfp pilus assembly ATPase PilB-like protein
MERGLSDGRPLVDALRDAADVASDTPPGAAAAELVAELEAGERMSDAMEKRPEAFSKAVCTMVRAGEAGGVLDVIAGRIAEALEDGSFTPPGAEGGPETQAERYWRALAWLLRSGVPILEAFALLRDETATGPLAEATDAIHRRILEGGTVAGAMRGFPDVFAAELCEAVDTAETQGGLDEVVLAIADALKVGDLSGLPKRSGDVPVAETDAPVVKLVVHMLLRALDERASDVHIDPHEDGTARVRLRVDGVLRDVDPLPEHLAQAAVSRIKVMASMDVAERRLPQDGRIALNVKGRKIDVRVCVVPTMFGERVCMRLLSREHAPLLLDQVGLSEDDLATVRDLCLLPHGIVIANGPTGCGKTTVMYSMLHELDRDKCCVISIEDPIEYTIDGVAQIAVRPQHGLTFARGIRSILRQDPDVVMVGEIRDFETLMIVVQTALTGHLAISALHCLDGPSTIRRMIDIGLEPFLVNSSLAGVISPRLVRTLCDACKGPAEPPRHSVPPEAEAFLRQSDATFYAPKGCDACQGTGYLGRTAIYEVMVMNDRIREAVHSEPALSNLRNAVAASGTKSMLLDGLEKAARGITSVAEVCRVVPRG